MIANAIGAEFRALVEREHQGKPARVVVAYRDYDTTAEDLWDALTNPERIPRWFAPVEGDLRLGGRYQVKGNAGGAITRCDPNEGFDIDWEFGGGKSWVTVRLEPKGEQTRLALEHIMWADDADQHWKQFGPAAVGVGWDLSFLGLGLHIETGEPVDMEGVNGWSSGDQGKAFMKASAAAWGRAHIACGEDPDVASAMAARTAAFYCGEAAP
ncbi:polyketide cyclase [Caulobacter sp. SLTY]|uniref:SRPBCC family protein n=1 Tax=Caulobacter sp. SLTY TaxID=2683262 RepID=UPI0014125565|nr:SRPBCC family protein [Caulobacter sp. SLTY]NBB16943.1 polyketide cyclase [Caulobacter sp. SLTY]